jgi:hypothetical protein
MLLLTVSTAISCIWHSACTLVQYNDFLPAVSKVYTEFVLLLLLSPTPGALNVFDVPRSSVRASFTYDADTGYGEPRQTPELCKHLIERKLVSNSGGLLDRHDGTRVTSAVVSC